MRRQVSFYRSFDDDSRTRAAWLAMVAVTRYISAGAIAISLIVPFAVFFLYPGEANIFVSRGRSRCLSSIGTRKTSKGSSRATSESSASAEKEAS